LLSPSLGLGADAATCGADGANNNPPITNAAVATIEILVIEFLCILTSLLVVTTLRFVPELGNGRLILSMFPACSRLTSIASVAYARFLWAMLGRP